MLLLTLSSSEVTSSRTDRGQNRQQPTGSNSKKANQPLPPAFGTSKTWPAIFHLAHLPSLTRRPLATRCPFNYEAELRLSQRSHVRAEMAAWLSARRAPPSQCASSSGRDRSGAALSENASRVRLRTRAPDDAALG
jgi:hypothetical protein